jgi:hypothetical protein
MEKDIVWLDIWIEDQGEKTGKGEVSKPRYDGKKHSDRRGCVNCDAFSFAVDVPQFILFL